MALAIQEVTEEIMIRMARHAKKLTGAKNLCLAGGVALNCVGNSAIKREKIFDDIWIQPAAGDAGGALGATQAVYHLYYKKDRTIPLSGDSMNGAYLGPSFSDMEIEHALKKEKAVWKKAENTDAVCETAASLMADGKVVGWFQGRMEWGPRALGNRSIVGDPRSPEMQKTLNLKIKFREGFRPFAPSVLVEDTKEYFNFEGESPYMLFTAPVQKPRRKPEPEGYADMNWKEKLYHLRSDIPSVTHLDYSARLQTVTKKTNPVYHSLISAFKKKTGYGVIVNTSFNVRGEPIVCTPTEAYRCFMSTHMDVLVLGSCILRKEDQPAGKVLSIEDTHGTD
jgi:carbamoyltransferase